jgi:uncharacterized protein
MSAPAATPAARRPSAIRALLGLGIGVAIGAVLVALVLWSRSGDGVGRLSTASLLGELIPAPGADGTDPVAAAPASTEVAFVRFVVDDIQDTWEQVFADAGVEYVRTQLVLYANEVRSGCGVAESSVGPFYCPVDGRVYLDLVFFDELADRFGAPGDFAEAYVIAHEFGHHVQNLLGVSVAVARASQADPSLANALSVRTELQADCLAGIWGHSAFEQEQLEEGDLEEALAAAAAVGDDRLQRAATGTINPDTFTHGTSDQRVAWFLAGFRSGDASTCDTFARADP